MTLLIAHRGDTIHYKENTLDAFISAINYGARGIELDVHYYNNEIIVVHDYLFDRNSLYPKLSDILSQINHNIRILIEIKEFNDLILAPLKVILERYPLLDIEITTSEIPIAPYIKSYFPQTHFGLILQDIIFQDWMTESVVFQKVAGWGKMTKAHRLHLTMKVLSRYGGKSIVNQLHDAGFEVSSHIFNTDKQLSDYSDLVSWGVDQCTFDNIELTKLIV